MIEQKRRERMMRVLAILERWHREKVNRVWSHYMRRMNE